MDNLNLRQGVRSNQWGPRLHVWPLAGKVWVTMIIVMMSLGLMVAVGQIVVHDIIPTFQDYAKDSMMHHDESKKHSDTHGDLFSDTPIEKEIAPFYQTDEFIFALKFTHIHIFGISAIFILMGILVLFLDLAQSTRIWLVVLPFIGIIIDLASVWLKLFVHPAFFWMHIPGGTLFGVVFVVDAVLMLWQMWSNPDIKT
ncbi:MAG: hypothetical protein OET81_08945 [Desulfobacteraceae bacterium]|nr:hypothetical protein [Desulfobacteraceae bacterium]MDH3722736.1 hypothetical protein [Desulfobacteraceae bacterium]MDH3839276.1 hypothetical protein [Desulfobacteraceae bacterium]MDH3875639.1 hypothetical protein [Desulfobacteraceae bacterium]MDH3956805.1 hypothetical protein [Desulfobacteraceae bacterium]